MLEAVFSGVTLPFAIAAVVVGTLAATLYLGPKAGKIVGALGAIIIAVLAIRKDAKDDARQQQTKEDLNAERQRNERIVAADRAGDAARSVPDDRLRDPDPFQLD